LIFFNKKNILFLFNILLKIKFIYKINNNTKKLNNNNKKINNHFHY
jgi:hypothetical protein